MTRTKVEFVQVEWFVARCGDFYHAVVCHRCCDFDFIPGREIHCALTTQGGTDRLKLSLDEKRPGIAQTILEIKRSKFYRIQRNVKDVAMYG